MMSFFLPRLRKPFCSKAIRDNKKSKGFGFCFDKAIAYWYNSQA
jgi:hypothetical protein